jgi:hypothetical protein
MSITATDRTPGPTEPPAGDPVAAVSTGDVLRVERGQAGPEELAAITAVLLARAGAAAQPAPDEHVRPRAGWRRLERESGFRPPHSWR